jgi:ribosomal protein S18 acetylase RimI-like enzyme
MSQFDVQPATAERWDDLQRVLTGGGDGKSCQCMWPLLTGREWSGTSVSERRRLLRAELDAEDRAPGLLAYDGPEPVGWVRVGPRPPLRRLTRSRIVTTGSQESLDDPKVWAVSCFSVRREHRKRGVVGTLLDAAIDEARAGGARIMEAYPFDTSVGTRTSNELYVGALSTFEAAGFAVIARPTAARAVVALEL